MEVEVDKTNIIDFGPNETHIVKGKYDLTARQFELHYCQNQ
jgi:hypothetical protein